MRPRLVVVGGSSNGFPRWGYLDKFAVNDYMARAFAVTVALSITVAWGLHVWRTLSPAVSPGAVRVIPLRGQVDIFPPPSISRGVTELSRPRVVRPAHPISIPRPVPVVDPDLEVDAFGSPGSTSMPITGAGTDADLESSVPEASGGVSPWPSPEDLVVVEQDPVLVAMQTPVYPEIARDAGLEGTVLVRALVNVDGAVREVRLLQSLLGFDEAALAAASTAVFRPAQQQGKPVAVWVVIPIEFRLRN